MEFANKLEVLDSTLSNIQHDLNSGQASPTFGPFLEGLAGMELNHLNQSQRKLVSDRIKNAADLMVKVNDSCVTASTTAMTASVGQDVTPNPTFFQNMDFAQKLGSLELALLKVQQDLNSKEATPNFRPFWQRLAAMGLNELNQAEMVLVSDRTRTAADLLGKVIDPCAPVSTLGQHETPNPDSHASVKVNFLEPTSSEPKALDTERKEALKRIAKSLETSTSVVSQPPANKLLNMTAQLDVSKMIIPPDESVLLGDLVGMEEAKAALIEACVLPWAYPHLIPKHLAWNGVLLFGGSGVGKSKVVKALINSLHQNMDLKCTFFQATGAHLLGNFYGDTERNITKLFEDASKYEHAIILIDEIDSICGIRSAQNKDTENKIVNHLLSTLDGIATDRQVVVVGTTNRPQFVDPAFYRRLKPIVYVQLPTKKERAELLKRKILKFQSANDIDFDYLAFATEGFSHADIDELLKRAYNNVRCGSVRNSLQQKLEAKDSQMINLDENLNLESYRELTHNDFLEALRQVAPTNSREDIEELHKFAEKYLGFDRIEIPDYSDCDCFDSDKCLTDPCNAFTDFCFGVLNFCCGNCASNGRVTTGLAAPMESFGSRYQGRRFPPQQRSGSGGRYICD